MSFWWCLPASRCCCSACSISSHVQGPSHPPRTHTPLTQASDCAPFYTSPALGARQPLSWHSPRALIVWRFKSRSAVNTERRGPFIRRERERKKQTQTQKNSLLPQPHQPSPSLNRVLCNAHIPGAAFAAFCSVFTALH
ncbi:hypothetical protein FKM82_011402 [Ascaphus truei]